MENLDLGKLSFKIVPELDSGAFAKADRDIADWKRRTELGQNPKLRLQVDDSQLNDLAQKVRQKLDAVATIKIKGDFSDIERKLGSLQQQFATGFKMNGVASGSQWGRSTSGFAGAALGSVVGGLGEAAILGKFLSGSRTASSNFVSTLSNDPNYSRTLVGSLVGPKKWDPLPFLEAGPPPSKDKNILQLGAGRERFHLVQSEAADNLASDMEEITFGQFKKMAAPQVGKRAHRVTHRPGYVNFGFSDIENLAMTDVGEIGGALGSIGTAGIGALLSASAANVAQTQRRRQQIQDLQAMSRYSGNSQMQFATSDMLRSFGDQDFSTDLMMGATTILSTVGLINPMSRREAAANMGNDAYKLSDRIRQQGVEDSYQLNAVRPMRTDVLNSQLGASNAGLYATPYAQTIQGIKSQTEIDIANTKNSELINSYGAPPAFQSEIKRFSEEKQEALKQQGQANLHGAEFNAYNKYISSKAEALSSGYASYGDIRNSISASYQGRIDVAQRMVDEATKNHSLQDFVQGNAELDIARNNKATGLRQYDFGKYGFEQGLAGSAVSSNLRAGGSFSNAGRQDIYNSTLQSVLSAKLNGYDPQVAVNAGLAQNEEYNQGLRTQNAGTNIGLATDIAASKLQAQYKGYEAEGVRTYGDTMAAIMADRNTDPQGYYHRSQLGQAGAASLMAQKAQLQLLNFPGPVANLGLEESPMTLIERNPNMLPGNIQGAINSKGVLAGQIPMDGSVLPFNSRLGGGIDLSEQPTDTAGLPSDIAKSKDLLDQILKLLKNNLGP